MAVVVVADRRGDELDERVPPCAVIPGLGTGADGLQCGDVSVSCAELRGGVPPFCRVPPFAGSPAAPAPLACTAELMLLGTVGEPAPPGAMCAQGLIWHRPLSPEMAGAFDSHAPPCTSRHEVPWDAAAAGWGPAEVGASPAHALDRGMIKAGCQGWCRRCRGYRGVLGWLPTWAQHGEQVEHVAGSVASPSGHHQPSSGVWSL